MKNNLTQADIISLLKIKLIAILIVCLSSYIQLSFFKDTLDSKAWRQLEYLWLFGFCIDFYMLIFAVIQALMKNHTSLVPGIAWLVYFVSMLFYGKLSFIKVETNNILLLSFLKGIEFLLLSMFHLLCIFAGGKILNFRNRNNT
jgi:hypothetical protein